ncbi:hypothetical protein [Mesoplasma florum]|uniref:hypothetical protein n=1 Tax=Mesoplasma florum TaxID=2151 RepID=UPI000D0894FE|nr:hypothetical protein [Mesoplasma florum]AVN61001.1 hypothetical protein CG005_01695 [Mesoplasma florum]
MNQQNLHINDLALIETFVKLQMFRNHDYWNILNQSKDEILEYLNEIIDSYYSYTKMGNLEKEKLNDKIKFKRDELELNKAKIGFDRYEYEMHSLYNSPKYFLIHSIHLSYYYTVISFEGEYLSISNLGQYICSDQFGENYFYLIPISPKNAILKRSIYSDSNKCFNFLVNNFFSSLEKKNNFKKIMFNELRTISEFSIASPSFLNDNFIEEFKKYLNTNIKIRVMDAKTKSNITIINK